MDPSTFFKAMGGIGAAFAEHAAGTAQRKAEFNQYQKAKQQSTQRTEHSTADWYLIYIHGHSRPFFSTITITDTTWST